MKDSPDVFPESSCRHVAPNDNAFAARMRFHQSWYRSTVLKLAPGPNPHTRSGELYGSMLTEADGLSGHNFLTGAARDEAEKRIRQGLMATVRLRNNLLSSQPFCFNILAPLAVDTQRATRLLRTIPGIPADLEATQLLFEYAPDKVDHLNDNTAFDACVFYTRPEGVRGFIGIETKLTEPFSQDEYRFSRRYSQFQNSPRWWWLAGAEVNFSNKQYNQLWRNHLLAFSMLDLNEYNEGYSVVISHERDTECKAAMTAYRTHLLPEGDLTLLDVRLDVLMERWDKAAIQTEYDWLRKVRQRYLDLDPSEDAWLKFRSIRGRST